MNRLWILLCVWIVAAYAGPVQKSPKGYICQYSEEEHVREKPYKTYKYDPEEEVEEEEELPVVRRLPARGKILTGRNGEVYYVVKAIRPRIREYRPIRTKSSPRRQQEYLAQMIDDPAEQQEYLADALAFENKEEPKRKEQSNKKYFIQQVEEDESFKKSAKAANSDDEEGEHKTYKTSQETKSKPARPQTRPVTCQDQNEYGSCEECAGRECAGDGYDEEDQKNSKSNSD